MKVIVKGSINLDKLAQKLLEIADHTATKVMQDTGTKINSFSVHEAEVTFKFDVEGVDEPQVMTVEHYEGKPEIFTWLVDAEADTTANNENESLFDAWTVAKAEGKELDFKEIESEYNEADIICEDSESYGDMTKDTYSIVGSKDKLVRVYQGNKLIQEYRLVAKEEKVEETANA